MFNVVRQNAKRVIACRASGASLDEIEAVREAGRIEVDKVRASIEAGEPDDGDRLEKASWEAHERRKQTQTGINEWYWNRLAQ